MRAVIKAGPGAGNIAVLDADIPSPGPGEALVRIGASALCGTDLLLYEGVYRGRNNPVPSPLIVGHEAAGEVVELGPGTTGPGSGTRVGIEAVWCCGRHHRTGTTRVSSSAAAAGGWRVSGRHVRAAGRRGASAAGGGPRRAG